VIFSGDKTVLDSSPTPTCTLDILRTRFAIDLAFCEASLLPLFDNYTAFCVVAASLSRFFSAFAASLTVVATSFFSFFTSLNPFSLYLCSFLFLLLIQYYYSF
jgi:hypothetical protein